jgi:hypothetical protein
LAGIVLFFFSQATSRALGFWRAAGRTGFAILVLTAARSWESFGLWDVSLFGNKGPVKGSGAPLFSQLFAMMPSDNEVLVIVYGLAMAVGIVAYYLFLPVAGSACYANLRRAERERALWDVALAGRASSDEFRTKMRAMVDTRIEDVGFHLRYAELLFGHGDAAGAAVEARLLLVQDPYHFNGNLLLANCYAALGLWAECLVVCDDYLSVAGYCFEFAELRQQCIAHGAKCELTDVGGAT